MGEITIAPGTRMRHPYAQGVRVGILTKEWPPDTYGGAGVHVEHLVAALRGMVDVQVQCFGAPRRDAMAHQVPVDLEAANPALQTLGVDLQMAMAANEVNLVHSHTWYANLAGHLAALLYDVPHVVTAHSLEPFRPWKQEQLGGGYRVSSWVEATAYGAAAAIIAVSAGMRRDVLQAYPQIDPSRVHVSTTASTPLHTTMRSMKTSSSITASIHSGHTCFSSEESPARRACPTSCEQHMRSRMISSWSCAPPLRIPLS